MKYFSTLKNVLFAGFALFSLNTMADEVIYERGFTTAWSASDIGDGAWSEASAGTAEISANALKYTSPSNGGGSTTLAVETKENSKLTIEASWLPAASIGRAGNHLYLKFGETFEIRSYGQDQKGTILIGSTETDITTGDKTSTRPGDDGTPWEIKLIIDRAAGTVDYSIVLSSGKEVKAEGVALSSTVFENVVMGFTRGGRTNTSWEYLKSLKITEEEQDVQTASYTVKYVFNGGEIKESSTRVGIVGAPVILQDADKEPVWNEDRSMKYIYESDNADQYTIGQDLIVTIYFREAEVYNYTVNAVVKEEVVESEEAENIFLAELVSGSNFEGETTYAYYKKYIQVNDQWYQTNQASSPWYGCVFTEDGTKDIVYTLAEQINCVFEGEELVVVGAGYSNGAYPDRYSNGGARRLWKNSYGYIEQPLGGTYKVSIIGRNQSSSTGGTLTFGMRNPNNETVQKLNDDLSLSWEAGNTSTQSIEGVGIPDGYQLVIMNNSEYNSNIEIDCIVLELTGYAPDVPTGINEVKTAAQSEVIYNIQGVRVSQPVKGLYIQNGKKFVVK